MRSAAATASASCTPTRPLLPRACSSRQARAIARSTRPAATNASASASTSGVAHAAARPGPSCATRSASTAATSTHSLPGMALGRPLCDLGVRRASAESPPESRPPLDGLPSSRRSCNVTTTPSAVRSAPAPDSVGDAATARTNRLAAPSATSMAAARHAGVIATCIAPACMSALSGNGAISVDASGV